MALETVRSRVVYRNRWMSVREDDIALSDGTPGLYGVVEKQDFALIVPVDDGGFHIVEQFRYAVGERFWEFPQGSWPSAAGAEVASVTAATRLAAAELREETGLVAESLRHLGRIHVAHGYSNQGCHVFRADGLTPGATDREATESDMRQRWVSAAELDRMVVDGEFVDGPSLAALTLLDRAGDGPTGSP